MKLLRLGLKTFRQHLSTTIQFQDGVTGILGRNGCGKTTLLEAISFAMYGSRALRGKLEDVPTRSNPKRNAFEVMLVFEHEGVVLTVTRTAANASLVQGGEGAPVVIGSREVTSRIENLLRMNHQEFVATYFTEQKGLEFLSAQKGALERERFIARMLGYDKLERMQELLRMDRKELKAEVQGYEASLQGREEIANRLALEKSQSELAKRRLDEAARVLLEGEKDEAVRKKAFQNSEVEFKELLKLRQQRDELLVRIDEKSNYIAKLKEELRILQEKREIFEHDLTSSKLKATDIESEITKREIALNDLREKVRILQENFQEKRSELSSIMRIAQEKVLELRKKQATLAVLQGNSLCPTCSQPLRESFLEVLAQEKSNLQKAEVDFRDSEKILENFTAQEKSEIVSQSMVLKQLIEDLNRFHAHRRIFLESSTAIERVNQQKSTLERELLVFRENLDLVAAKIERLAAVEDRYLKVKGAYEAALRLCEVGRLQRVRLEGELSTAQALYQRSEATLAELDAKSELLRQKTKELSVLEESDQVLTAFRRDLNAELRPVLSHLASDFVTELTDGRYTEVEVGEDFSPHLMEAGDKKAVISGGEEDILNLCMRLALSHLLAERSGQYISLLVLDEVFGSLDESRRENVLMLLDKLRSRFEQIFIITHFDDIKDAVRNVVEVGYDEVSGASTIADARSEHLLEADDVGNI